MAQIEVLMRERRQLSIPEAKGRLMMAGAVLERESSKTLWSKAAATAVFGSGISVLLASPRVRRMLLDLLKLGLDVCARKRAAHDTTIPPENLGR